MGIFLDFGQLRLTQDPRSWGHGNIGKDKQTIIIAEEKSVKKMSVPENPQGKAT